MRKLLKHSAAFAVLAIVAHATPAAATLTPYDSRALFSAASGPTTTETFNSFTTDVSFAGTPLTIGAFTVVSSGPGGSYNTIDAQPLSFGTPEDVDGTTVLFALVTNSSSVIFTFASPVTAFGADFSNLQNTSGGTAITAAGQTLNPPTSASNVRFYGFTSTAAFTTVTFTASANDGFGIDNLSYATASTAVPEPASWVVLTTGFGVLGAAIRRRKAAIGLI